MRGADILVEMLIGYGVETIFGVPGDTNVPFYEALQGREDRIRHVMARDERSAGYMADAYGRFTNKPGIFECPSGAGAMYSLPPVAESNGSSVPVILLTIDIPLPGEGRGVLTELDCAKLFEPDLAWQLRRENGIVWQEWDETELRERLPAVGKVYRFAAYLAAGAHCLNTSAYVAAIVKAATDAGATLIARQVAGLSTDRGNRVVFANGDTLEADLVVVACGIHAKKLMATIGVKIPMESERGYHATISGLDVPFDIPVMPSSGKMANTPTHMGLRLSGQVELSRVEDAPDWARSSILYQHALATYPYLRDNPDVRIQNWMGHRPSVSDGLPVIGRLRNRPGIVLAYGHGHVGIASAPKTADIVTRAMEQRSEDQDRAFSPARFGY